MENFPKITVVTSVFNCVKYIESTLQSILSQNYPNLEYVVIDGGSTDGTIEIIEKYRTQLFYFSSEKDKGLYDGLNKGFRKSTGDIMCYINGDDLHHPRSLFCVAEIFNQLPQVEWLTGNPTCFDNQGLCREIVPQRKWSVYQYLMGDYFTIQQESVFWRRSIWEKCGSTFTHDYKLAGDFELWMRFFRSGAKLYSTKALLGGFRIHGKDQLSYALEKYSEEIEDIYRKMKLTDSEKMILAKIKKLERINKIPVIRGRLRVYEKLEKIYDFPPMVYYDFVEKKYCLK